MQPNSAYIKQVVGDIWSHYFLFYILHDFSICLYLQLLPAVVEMAIQTETWNKELLETYFCGFWTPDSH
jgi:hypothetical protein